MARVPTCVVVALCLSFIAAAAATDAPVPKDLSFSAWLTQQHGNQQGTKATIASAARHNRFYTDHICFQETQQHSCRNIGDYSPGLDINIAQPLVYSPGTYIESDIACCKKDAYDDHSSGRNNWGMALTQANVGTCEWSIFWFIKTYEGTGADDIKVSDYMYKLGTARAVCTIAKDAEECGPLCGETTITLEGQIYNALVYTPSLNVAPVLDEDCTYTWDYAPPYLTAPPPRATTNATRGGGRAAAPRAPRGTMTPNRRRRTEAMKATREGRRLQRNGNAKAAAASVASATPQDYHHQYNDITITPPLNQAWTLVIAGQVYPPVGPVDTGIRGGMFDFPINTYEYFTPEEPHAPGAKLPTVTAGTYNIQLWREPSLREQLEMIKEEDSYSS